MGRRLPPHLVRSKLDLAGRRRLHGLDLADSRRRRRARPRHRLTHVPGSPAPRQSIHSGPQNDTRLALLDWLTSIRAETPCPRLSRFWKPGTPPSPDFSSARPSMNAGPCRWRKSNARQVTRDSAPRERRSADPGEFERETDAMPNLKKAELIEGVVYMPSPVRLRRHGQPHAHVLGWLTTYKAGTVGVIVADNASARLDLDNEPEPRWPLADRSGIWRPVSDLRRRLH